MVVWVFCCGAHNRKSCAWLRLIAFWEKALSLIGEKSRPVVACCAMCGVVSSCHGAIGPVGDVCCGWGHLPLLSHEGPPVSSDTHLNYIESHETPCPPGQSCWLRRYFCECVLCVLESASPSPPGPSRVTAGDGSQPPARARPSQPGPAPARRQPDRAAAIRQGPAWRKKETAKSQ